MRRQGRQPRAAVEDPGQGRWRVHHRGERGLTLLETLVTVVLLSIALVGIVGGVAAAERAASTTQDQSQLEVAMRQLSDFVRDTTSAGLAYQPCAQVSSPVTANAAGTTSGTYASQIDALKTSLKAAGNLWNVGQWGFTAIYESTNGSHDTSSSVGALWTTGCANGTGDYGVQKIMLAVFDATGTRSITRTVWKSVAWCYQGQLQSPNPVVTTC